MHPPPVHSPAAVPGQERRVDIDDPAAPGPHDGSRHRLEIAGQHHQIHPGRFERRAPLPGIGGILEQVHRNAMVPGQLDAAGFGPVAQDQNHLRRGAVPEGVEECRQIAAPSGNRRRHAQEHSPEI
jgi:hypothetical protein